LRTDRVTAETVVRLREAGIPSVVLKGPSTARWLYDGRDCRTYDDTDILVPPPLEAAGQVLAACGFERKMPESTEPWTPHAENWERSGDGAAVDLHRSFHGVGVDDATAWAVLARHTEPLEVGGVEVAVLDIPARALTVALHAASGHARDRVVQDLHRALERVPLERWSEAYRIAVDLGAVGPFGLSLRLLPGGRDVASELGLPEAVDTFWVLRNRGDRRLLGSTLRLAWLGSLPTIRQKVGFVVRCLFPPPWVIRRWMAANPVRRNWIPLGYGRRIAAKVRTAPTAYREWRRAQHEAG
jgi:hypothetical protein